ncbi:release factor glutamine methyltransferase [Seinonella peptonophila]|uniref:peptide chain release factor N(5)-glutamine methyltransferase n=1 Tax=Seinonella peptonophila TaxID=112248 RepID=A0A1M4TD55_9BACL|nr:putative protein N(5)-glutamine methyltransferase [Seinonella peptonophila]SHE42298.1 release factor glutamine methyltransferase [Seinonella peptonophila]
MGVIIVEKINRDEKDAAFANIVNRLRNAGCVFAEDETRLLISSAQTLVDLISMVEKRESGLPLEHVIGWTDFCGLRIAVDSGVFVPRRRTEFLVQQAAILARPKSIVVDLCCGSGAIGAVLITWLDQIKLYAVDIDPIAVKCAQRNLPNGQVFRGDLFKPLPDALKGHVDVLVANVPYVPTESINLLPSEARIHEALVALDGGKDGLNIQRRVAASAPHWLSPNGHLLIETSEQQAPQTVEIFAANGLIPKVASFNELDATVVIGTRPTLKRND